MRPSARTWIKHLVLLLITFCTVTIAGVLQPFGFIPIFPDANPQSWTEILQFLISLPSEYARLLIQIVTLFATNAEISYGGATFSILQYGLEFSVSLLFILASHEAGHYVTCRIYGVDATLPYFIPTPPLIGPAGTLGAFIKILSPMQSRRMTFDIGVAGPIAGFIALIPVALAGFITWHSAPIVQSADTAAGGFVFFDPLLFRFLAYLFNINLSAAVYPNPFYFASWLGLLITSLNLIPSGQLDGGHAIYAIFGRKIHKLTGIIVFILMAILTVIGWLVYNSPSGLLFTVLLAVMMRIKHPEPLNNTPLDFKRKIIAILTLLIFILSFMPFPIQIQ